MHFKNPGNTALSITSKLHETLTFQKNSNLLRGTARISGLGDEGELERPKRKITT